MRTALGFPVALLACFGGATACVGLAIGGADGGEGTGDGFGGPVVAVEGTVLRTLCDTVPGASVEVLDGTDAPALSDAQGRFQLRAPQRSALLVKRPGAVPTLTFGRQLSDGQTGVQAASVPADFSLLFHALASFELTPAVGTVALVVLDESPLPVTDAEVTLLDLQGAQVPANARRRSPSFDGTSFQMLSTQGTANTGIAAFFQVAPGLYRVHVERAGYTFPEVLVPVRGGTVSLDLVRGAGTGGTAPVPLAGTVKAFPPFPMADGPAAALGGAAVTLAMDDGTTLETSTDGAGAYAFIFPSVGHWFDVTVAKPSYGTLRSEQQCAGHFNTMNFTLNDKFYDDRYLGQVLGATPAAADAGGLFAFVVRANGAGVGGAVLSTEPALPAPFYGQDFTRPYSCARSACGDGGSCPSGQRCEAGECVLGATGPLCQSCMSASCPQGYQGWGTTSLDGGATCSCLPSTTACSLAAPTCEQGTYCWTFTDVDGGIQQITGSYCLLSMPQFTGSAVVQGEAQPVTFANVPPGLYLVSGELDGGALEPRRVRVSAGVQTGSNLIAP